MVCNHTEGNIIKKIHDRHYDVLCISCKELLICGLSATEVQRLIK